MKEAYYFSHDSNARTDEKILPVRAKHGAKGYGIYFMIIEMLRDATGYKLQCDYSAIAYELHEAVEDVEDVVKNYDLFKIKDGYFWSESFLERMKKKEQKSRKARESALKRWGVTEEKDANAMQTHSEGNAIKERKGKERKGNKKKTSNIYTADSSEYRLAILLANKILQNNPSHRFSIMSEKEFDNKMQSWCADIDKILQIDKRTFEQVEVMIRWCQQDSFWQANILSASKLREKFDTLIAQCKRNGIKNKVYKIS